MLLIQVCHICSLSFLVLFGSILDFVFLLRIIRTTGRSEGKNLSNIRLEIKYIIMGVDHFAPIIFEMINECTSNLLKHLEKTFPKASNCLENKIQKNCTQKSIKIKKNDFRCWSVLTPYVPFYLGNIFWMVTRHALN